MCGLVVYTGNSSKLDDFQKHVQKIIHRGPDRLIMHNNGKGLIAFHRLRIMDLSNRGDQPFTDMTTDNMVVCNGEIYNSDQLRKDVDYQFQSESDCEVLLPLYSKLGLVKMASTLDAEFAFVLWDASKKKFVAGRDPIGIRPLFYGYTIAENKIMFSSEVKAIQHYCSIVKPFPPGHVYDGTKFISYLDITKPTIVHNHSEETVIQKIHEKLEKAIIKRLHSDAPVGFLLSGGLDSSIVCAVGQKYTDTPIKTFAVGMDKDPIDLKYAREVADHIGSDHTEVIITKQDVLDSLLDVIWHLESFDITTIRASIGMFLICKSITETSGIKVLLTGEVSDELFGYKYTDFAPSPEEFQLEAQKRIKELYLYDVLRADRCISAHAIEARVPFSDKDFVKYVMAIDPQMKMNSSGYGKYLLRKAFDRENYLPHHILWREKAAFSDAVGHSLVDTLKEKAEQMYSDREFEFLKKKYSHATPISKESLMYREIFEELFPNKAELIPSFWMPNKNWQNCDVSDPSARVLPNYGDSGK